MIAAATDEKLLTHDLVIMSLESFELSIVNRFKKAHNKKINCIQELPNGLCATGSGDDTIKIWDCEAFS